MVWSLKVGQKAFGILWVVEVPVGRSHSGHPGLIQEATDGTTAAQKVAAHFFKEQGSREARVLWNRQEVTKLMCDSTSCPINNFNNLKTVGNWAHNSQTRCWVDIAFTLNPGAGQEQWIECCLITDATSASFTSAYGRRRAKVATTVARAEHDIKHPSCLPLFFITHFFHSCCNLHLSPTICTSNESCDAGMAPLMARVSLVSLPELQISEANWLPDCVTCAWWARPAKRKQENKTAASSDLLSWCMLMLVKFCVHSSPLVYKW